MAGLHVKIVHGENMIVNGAAILFQSDCNLRFLNKVRFLSGRQLMLPATVTNTSRRIYSAIQTAYVGDPQECDAALIEAGNMIKLLREVTTSAMARELLDRAWKAASEGQFYIALKAAARLVRHEDAILGSPGLIAPELNSFLEH